MKLRKAKKYVKRYYPNTTVKYNGWFDYWEATERLYFSFIGPMDAWIGAYKEVKSKNFGRW